MRQRSRELKEQESEQPGTVDAAQAFEALQAEVALQRRAIEALGQMLEDGLEGQPSGQLGPDLSENIAQILEGQAYVTKQVEMLRQHPALQLMPEQYGQTLAHAGSVVVREAVQELRQATQAVERERAQLGHLIGTVNVKGQQKRFLWWVTSSALATGLMLSPLFIRSLPVTLSSQVAAFLIKENRWAGGALLMQLENPLQWPGMADALRLAQANEAALTSCRSLAAKTKHEQRCTIVMPAQ